jgi:hypothetical protein
MNREPPAWYQQSIAPAYETTLMDQFASMALYRGEEPAEAWRIAMAMMEERRRIKEMEAPKNEV